MAMIGDGEIRKLCVAIDRLSANEKEFLETSLILAKILQNAVSFFHGEDDRYRRLRRSSPVVARGGVHHFLRSAGFLDTHDDRGSFLVLPSNASLQNVEQHKRLLLAQRREHNVLEAFEVPALSLHAKKRIGKGKFGEVYCGTLDGRSVAIKRLKAECDPQVIRDFRQEAYLMHMMSKPKHPNIVELLAVVLTDNYSFIIMDLMKACFVNMLREGFAGTPREQLDGVLHVVAGMAHLHERRILHCDLAARNILMAEDGTLKISDFGLARMAGSLECNVGGKGGKFPIRWSAPELFTGSPLSKETDIWSFGVLFFEFVTAGSMPYGDFTNDETKRRVLEKYRLPQPQSCPDEFYAIMKRCWAKKPSARPSFSALTSDLSKLKKKFPSQDEVHRFNKEDSHRSETESPISLYSTGSMDSSGSGDLILQGTDTLSPGSVATLIGAKEKDKEKKSRSLLTKRFTFGRSRSSSLKGIELIRIYTLLVDQFQSYVVLPVKPKHLCQEVVHMVLKRLGKPTSDAPSFHLVEVRKGMSDAGMQSRFMFENESPVNLKANWREDGYILVCHARTGHTNLLEAIDSFFKDPQYVARLKQPMCGYLRKDAIQTPGRRVSRKWWSYWTVVDGSTVLFYQSEEAQEQQDDPMAYISLSEASIDLHEISRKADAVPAVRVLTSTGETHLLQASSKDAMYRWLEALLSSVNLQPSVLMEDQSCRLIHKGHLNVTREHLQTPNQQLVDLGRSVYALKGQHLVERLSRRQLFSVLSMVAISVKNPPEVPIDRAALSTPMSRLSVAFATNGPLEYGIRVDTTGNEGGVTRYFLQPDTPGELEAWVEAFDTLLLECGRSELMMPIADEDDAISETDSGQGVSVEDLTGLRRSSHEMPAKITEENDVSGSVAKGAVTEPFSRGSPTRLSIRRRSRHGYSMAHASERSMAESGIYDSDDISSSQRVTSYLNEGNEQLDFSRITGKRVASWLQGITDDSLEQTTDVSSLAQAKDADEEAKPDYPLLVDTIDTEDRTSPSHSLSSQSSQSTVHDTNETDSADLAIMSTDDLMPMPDDHEEPEETPPVRPPTPEMTSALGKQALGKSRGPPPPPPQRKKKPAVTPRKTGQFSPNSLPKPLENADTVEGERSNAQVPHEAPNATQRISNSVKAATAPVPSPRKRQSAPVSSKPQRMYEFQPPPRNVTTDGSDSHKFPEAAGNAVKEEESNDSNEKKGHSQELDNKHKAGFDTAGQSPTKRSVRKPPVTQRTHTDLSGKVSPAQSESLSSASTTSSTTDESPSRALVGRTASTGQIGRNSETGARQPPPLPPELPEKQKRKDTIAEGRRDPAPDGQPPPLPVKSSRLVHKSPQHTFKPDAQLLRQMTAPPLTTVEDNELTSPKHNQTDSSKVSITPSLSNPVAQGLIGTNSLPRKNSRSNSLPDATAQAHQLSAQSVNFFGSPVVRGSTHKSATKHPMHSQEELSSASSSSSLSSITTPTGLPRPHPVASLPPLDGGYDDYMPMSSTPPVVGTPHGKKISHEYMEIDYPSGLPEDPSLEPYLEMAPAAGAAKTEGGALTGDGEYVQMASNIAPPPKASTSQKREMLPPETRKYEVIDLPMPSGNVPPPMVGNRARTVTPVLPEPAAESEAPYGFHSLPDRSSRHREQRSPAKSTLFTGQRSVVPAAQRTSPSKSVDKKQKEKTQVLSGEQVAGTGIAARRRGSNDSARQKALERAGKDLPPGWTVVIDSTGKTMFCHTIHQNLRVSSLAMVKRAEQLISARSDETPTNQEPGPGWKSAQDPNGKTYYYHSKTKRTTWKVSDTWSSNK